MNPTILFVDDEPSVRRGMRRILSESDCNWDLQFAESAEEALSFLEQFTIHTLVTDQHMPGMCGIELIRKVRENPRFENLPIVLLTGSQDRELKREALAAGVTDLVNKPVEPDDLIARIRNMLRLRQFQDQLAIRSAELGEMVKERTHELESSRIEVVWRLAKAAETRDIETGMHTMRVGYFAQAVAKELLLDRQYCDHLFLAAPLHDIGKLGVPDYILQKTGRLTDEERAIMERHCVIGYNILMAKFAPPKIHFEGCEDFVVAPSPFIALASIVALQHHEKWDGSGYPNGLRGDLIDLSARITAVVDVFDALRSERPYKRAFTEDEAIEILRNDSGKHFDPEITTAFLDTLPVIRAIAKDLSDESDMMAA